MGRDYRVGGIDAGEVAAMKCEVCGQREVARAILIRPIKPDGSSIIPAPRGSTIWLIRTCDLCLPFKLERYEEVITKIVTIRRLSDAKPPQNR